MEDVRKVVSDLKSGTLLGLELGYKSWANPIRADLSNGMVSPGPSPKLD